MGDGGFIDMMVGALTDPFDTVHMGITAENIAAQWKISREQQDEFAVESHRRAISAIEKGYFKDQILPIELKTRKGTTLFDKDEHPRADVTLEGLAKLRAAFKKEGGSVTAGNASGINDGAAAVVLMEKEAALKAGLKPMARLVSYGLAGVDPKIMGIGPVPAVQNALKRAGLKVEDMDVIESNEAFAVQALAVSCDLKFDPKKTNPNGGAVGLGHPIGATGALLTDNAGIAAYLEARFPNPPMLGSTPLAQAQIASWHWRAEFEGLMAIAEALRNSSPAMVNRALPGPVAYARIPALAERGLARLRQFFDELDAHLAGRDAIADSGFSIADITAVVAVDFARVVRVRPGEQHANLRRWREAMALRPSMQ